MERDARPAFTGLLVYEDPTFGFSVLVPDGWHRLSLSESSSGVFFAPDDADPLTGLAIEVKRLGTRIRPSDLPTVRRGLLSGLRNLPGYRIEQDEAEAVDQLLTLEARLTFTEDGCTRKRWVRLLYLGRTQVRLIAQGASIELFEYWEPMFFEAMRTIHFGSGF